MAAKPIKSLELHYIMIEFLINTLYPPLPNHKKIVKYILLGKGGKTASFSELHFTSIRSSSKYKLLRFVCRKYSHMEPKRGAKNWVHSVLTHNKLPLFMVLKVPPDLSYGPVMTVS